MLKFMASMWICARSITYLKHTWVNSNLSDVDGWCAANAIVEALKSIRNDENFELFW